MRWTYKSVGDFFEELLCDLECQDDTRAYIVSIFQKYKATDFDLSQDNITLLFAQARQQHNFLLYRSLGDWIFWGNTMVPQYFSSKDYYDSIARLSYYSCYKLINHQWKLYEELADNFTLLEAQVRSRVPLISPK